ncbi:hypothetical protein [Ferrimicrobium acidiphilum]|jgi:hypothetical protein|uniref:hypothetical protein n=1 Tax=Ferrimicrobium acidiphilum TaxID=121039 RepID=UPI0023F53E5C|nr:hypothetical protein [Ferrimicrobium acidiphilum]
MQYVFLLILAASGGYLAMSVYDNIVSKRQETSDAVLSGLTKERNHVKWLRFSRTWFVVAAVIGALIFPPTGSLFLSVFVGIAIYVSLMLVTANATTARIEDIEAVLVFAQTVFPLLSSPLSRGAVLDQASVALTPRLRRDLEEVRKYGSQNALTQSQVMHLFAVMEDSAEIDIIMAVMAITFDIGSESLDEDIGNTVVEILNGALDGLTQVQKDRQELLLAGKMIVIGGIGMLEFLMYALGGLVGDPWRSLLGEIIIVLVSLLVLGASAIFKRLSRSRVALRLIDGEYVLRKIRLTAKGANV